MSTREHRVVARGPEGTEWPDELVELYRAQHELLIRTAYLIVGSRSAAEEVVHDAVLALCRRWDSVQSPGAYLRTAVSNRAIDVVRHRRIAERHVVEPPTPSMPSELVELRDALLHLPIRHRTAIILRYLADLDDRDIAEVLGCRPATVRSLVARGLTRLRKEVTP